MDSENILELSVALKNVGECHSVNLPAYKTLNKVKYGILKEMAKRLGVDLSE